MDISQLLEDLDKYTGKVRQFKDDTYSKFCLSHPDQKAYGFMRFQEKHHAAGLCKKCFKQVSGKGYDVVKVRKKEKVYPNLNEK